MNARVSLQALHLGRIRRSPASGEDNVYVTLSRYLAGTGLPFIARKQDSTLTETCGKEAGGGVLLPSVQCFVPFARTQNTGFRYIAFEAGCLDEQNEQGVITTPVKQVMFTSPVKQDVVINPVKQDVLIKPVVDPREKWFCEFTIWGICLAFCHDTP
jgi:hypothetical protein